MLYGRNWTCDLGRNAWHESPKKRRNTVKTAFLTKNIKNFHKSKIDGLQKLSTGASWFYDFLHFKGWSYKNHKISLPYDHYFVCFLAFLTFLWCLFIWKYIQNSIFLSGFNLISMNHCILTKVQQFCCKSYYNLSKTR